MSERTRTFLQVILEWEREKSAIYSVSISASRDCTRAFLQEREFHMAVLLEESRLPAGVFATSPI